LSGFLKENVKRADFWLINEKRVLLEEERKYNFSFWAIFLSAVCGSIFYPSN
jgi:hypothetical protein